MSVSQRLHIESRPVTVKDVVHRYKDLAAVDGVSIEVLPGEFLTLLGPSGSGKTTLLRIIAGLISPSTGTVSIGDRDVTRLAPQHRDIGMVFQNYSLFPHMSVAANVAYPLAIRRVPRQERAARVDRVLERVNLAGLGSRRPAALSGGQQQRVAVARALVFEPSVLLMDEPLGALDRKLRRHMQSELRGLQQQLGITCIFVTHDQEEALTMSDRIGVMNNGKLLQLDTPVNLYRDPVDNFVANFVGDTNSFDGCVEDVGEGRAVRTASGLCLPLNAGHGRNVGDRVVVGIRPEHVHVGSTAGDVNSLQVDLEEVMFAGPVIQIKGRTQSGDLIAAQLSGTANVSLSVGTPAVFSWQQSDQIVHAS